MSHPEWHAMSGEQKMEFLYSWCLQMSEVVLLVRRCLQSALMDKIVRRVRDAGMGRLVQ